MAEELKACPCCGEGAEIDTRQTFRSIDGGRLMEALAVYCTGCSLQITVCYADVPDITPQQVIAMWNTRAQLPSQGGEAVAPACWQYKVYEERRFYPTDPRKQDFWSALDGIAHSAEPLYTHPADQVAGSVVVSRELLERISSLCMYTLSSADYDELRALLAKSEGVKP